MSDTELPQNRRVLTILSLFSAVSQAEPLRSKRRDAVGYYSQTPSRLAGHGGLHTAPPQSFADPGARCEV